jgi:hypothetical protein
MHELVTAGRIRERGLVCIDQIDGMAVEPALRAAARWIEQAGVRPPARLLRVQVPAALEAVRTE